MSKRSGKKANAKPDGAGFANNALGGLAGLKSNLQSAPTPTQTVAKSAPSVKPRFPNKLVVRMEKKGRRGKTVTRISGLPTRELSALCTEMKKALGCGGTTEQQDLILSGNLVERTATWLEAAGATNVVRG